MAKKLSLYENVYRNLDNTYIGAEKHEVPGTRAERYNNLSEMKIDFDENGREVIVVTAKSLERLAFAEKVAKFYNTPYTIVEETWRKNPSEHYKIKICVEE